MPQDMSDAPAFAADDALNPHYAWDRAIPAPGHSGVDFEQRVDFSRLHKYRLGRAHEALANSDLGALLCFDNNNIRYLTSTVIGEWSRDKVARYAMLMGDQDPHLWDFGSAAAHHRLHAPWLPTDNCHAGMLGLRGTVPPSAGLMDSAAKEIKQMLVDNGMADMPLGVDICEPPMMLALQAEGIAKANEMLYEMGSDDVEAINAISGERCNPHPHNFTDRIVRPGDQAFFDILHSYSGYRTCYYRTFNVGRSTDSQSDAYKQCREWIDAAIDLVRPGVSTDEIAAVWPKAEEFGFSDEMEAFALQFGHGLGVAIHERPIISRLCSMDDPKEIKTGMVFALETYCPATDGFSAARIEEEMVVTPDGPQIISLYPAEELPIANKY